MRLLSALFAGGAGFRAAASDDVAAAPPRERAPKLYSVICLDGVDCSFPVCVMETPERVFDLIRYQLNHHPQDDAFAQRVDGKWTKVSTSQCADAIAALSWGLHLAGIRAGDRIANVSETNRIEWYIIDAAVMSLGAVHVPIYPNIYAEEFEFILSDSEARLLFVSSECLYQTIAPLQARLPALRQIISYDPVSGVKPWKQIRDAGKAGLENPESKSGFEKIKANVRPNDLAMLIYTSGTTGIPKGVMLSHANLLANCMACARLIQSNTQERALSFLPLCHIYERTVINVYVYVGTSVYFAQNLNTIGEDLRDVRPHVFTTVPRLLEKIYEKILAKGNELRGLKRATYFWALRLGSEFDPDASPSWLQKMQLVLADRLVYSHWRQSLGGRVRAIICGSAALQPRLGRVFWAARIPVYEGYGPTEASPVIAANYPEKNRHKLGTVGPVIPGGEVKIAPDGEILYRGPNVMTGYYHRPEKTAEVIDQDGWLHTGDVGEFDGAFLKITDRKKEIFKTSGGKYIAPQQIENTLKESPFIGQTMVVGENRKFPAALVVPAFEAVTNYFRRRGVQFRSNRELVTNPEVNELIASEIRKLNEHFGHYARIKKIILLAEEWSLAGGELTPTLKLKRQQILTRHANEIESLYTGTEQSTDAAEASKEQAHSSVTTVASV
jgi:long-chain acyl-CoA synthetase